MALPGVPANVMMVFVVMDVRVMSRTMIRPGRSRSRECDDH
jgi:hypothetical protein